MRLERILPSERSGARTRRRFPGGPWRIADRPQVFLKKMEPFGVESDRSPEAETERREAPRDIPLDLIGTGARGNYEIVLESFVIAVVEQVDARIDILILHGGEGGEAQCANWQGCLPMR